MAGDAKWLAPHDPAARGFDGRLLAPVDPPAPGEAPSPAWLAQLGRASFGDSAAGRVVVKRLTEDGLAVPGDDPLYQYLGAHRLLEEVLRAQHEDHLGRMRAMFDEARQSLAQLLAEVGAAGGAAEAARRGEDKAAMKRFSTELDERIAAGARTLRETMAEERDITAAAITVAVAEALAGVGGEKTAGSGPGGTGQPRGWGPWGAGWPARGRSAATWAAVLTGSVIVGLALLWALKH